MTFPATPAVLAQALTNAAHHARLPIPGIIDCTQACAELSSTLLLATDMNASHPDTVLPVDTA
jgi:hypothetical protein